LLRGKGLETFKQLFPLCNTSHNCEMIIEAKEIPTIGLTWRRKEKAHRIYCCSSCSSPSCQNAKPPKHLEELG